MEVLQARATITSLIQTISKEHGINDYLITDVKTNQKGVGYLGEIFMVTVKDSSSNKQLAMVIKAAFGDQKIREIISIQKSYQNEIYFYTKVLPVYESLEKERGSLQSTQYVPKCLKVSAREREEMLALEDLKSSCFEVFDMKSVLDDEHVRLIFKTYGRLHGYSFALRDQRPEEYEQVTKGVFNMFEEFVKYDFWPQYMKRISKLVQSILVPGEDDEIIAKFEKYSGENMFNVFFDLSTERVENAAILHGDGWSNNMMFKYEDTSNGRRPVDMRLIDWQLLNVGSPVCDLSYCLYSGASRKTFDNLNEYLRIYHDSLSKQIKALGSDPEKLFPFSCLNEHWKKYSRWGMILALPVLKIKLTDNKEVIDLTDGYDRNEFTDAFFNTKFDEESYKERVREILWHMSQVDAL